MDQQLSQESRQQIRKKTAENKFFSLVVQKIGNDNLACIFLFIGSCTWTIGFIYPNQHNFHSSLTIIIRGACVTILSYLLCLRLGYETDFKNPLTFHQLFFRNLIKVFHGVVFAIIPFYLPQFLIHTIACSGPLGVFVIDYYKFGITINRKQFIGIVIGVIGIIFTINGKLITSYIDPSYEFHTQFPNYKTDSIFVQIFMSIILLFAMGLWSYGASITKKINNNGVQINFHLGTMLILTGGIMYPLTYDPNNQLTITQFLYGMLLSGGIIALGQILYVIALSIAANTGLVTLMSFNAVIISYLISIFRYGEAINYVCLVGGALIIYGVVIVVFNKEIKNVKT